MYFTPLQDFDDKDLRSSYLAGLSYTVRARPANPLDKNDEGVPLEKTLLYAKVQQWLKEGKVRLGAADARGTAGPARIKGTGIVK